MVQQLFGALSFERVDHDLDHFVALACKARVQYRIQAFNFVLQVFGYIGAMLPHWISAAPDSAFGAVMFSFGETGLSVLLLIGLILLGSWLYKFRRRA